MNEISKFQYRQKTLQYSYDVQFGFDNDNKIRKSLFINDMPKSVTGPTLNLELADEYESFLNELLSSTSILSWKKVYEPDSIILDGISWEIDLSFDDGCNSRIVGHNSFPDEFEQLLSLINKYIGTNFRNEK